VVEHLGVGQAEVLGGAAGEVRRQTHPVVGRPGFLPEGDDPPTVGGAVVHEAFEELVADHALADHDESLLCAHDAFERKWSPLPGRVSCVSGV
jgi:hypothetical protein